jgi:hypothetical protein
MKKHYLLYGVFGAFAGVFSTAIFFALLWYVHTKADELMFPHSSTASSELMHADVSKELRETKVGRDLIRQRFVTNDSFLNVFAMLDAIKKSSEVSLSVESVNAESVATKNSLATARVVLSLHGSWNSIIKTYRAMSLTPIAISIVSAEITSSEKPLEYDGKVVLRVYIKPEKI